MPSLASGQSESAGEYELKAVMLYNLAKFVEWPPTAYPDAQPPTVLCILGQDPFGDSLTSIASAARPGGKVLQIRHIPNEKGVRGCHVVFISSSERKSIGQILSALKGSSILTVGEMTLFAARGGMIQFSLEEKQVRFQINLEAASKSNLKISSRLLVLARIVKDQSNDPSGSGSAIPPSGFEIAGTMSPGRSIDPEKNSIAARVQSEH
jgi:hypothetical protein